MILNKLILNSYQYNFIFISLLVLKIWIRLKIKYFSPEGGCLIMAMSTGACWGGHFCVEPGIFVSNRLFCVEPCILLSNRAFLCRTSVIMNFIPGLWVLLQPFWLWHDDTSDRLLDINVYKTILPRNLNQVLFYSIRVSYGHYNCGDRDHQHVCHYFSERDKNFVPVFP